MKAIVVNGYPDAQPQLIDYPKKGLMAGDVRIKVAYSALNYKDMLAITGKGKILRTLPLIPGIDLAGEVLESEDKRFQVGDRVFVVGAGLGEKVNGGLAEQAIVSADCLIKMPEKWSYKAAMLLGTAGFSTVLAILSLQNQDITPDMGEVLVTGTSGGVGLWALRMLAYLGYDVLALTQYPEKYEDLFFRFGAHQVQNYSEFVKPPKALETARFAAAVDTLGGEILSAILPKILPNGAVATIGNVLGNSAELSLMPFILRGVSLLGVASSDHTPDLRNEYWRWIALTFPIEFIDEMPYTEIALEEVFTTTENWSKIPAGRVIVNIQGE